MLIDWFTVGAQVLNFVFLVWLMKRFLYQPVRDAIAAREKRIADQIAAAAATQAQAATERKTFEDKNKAFDQQRADLLSKAVAHAAAEGQRLAEETRKAAAAVAAQRQQSLATQAAQLQQLVAERAAHEVFAIARKTLADLANADLEERMVAVFTRRLGDVAEPARQLLGSALQQSTEPALVRSYFPLPAAQQTAIRNAVNAAFSADIALRFETAADAVCGIELSAGGQKLAWTIAQYLRDLEHTVAAVLTSTTVPATAPTVSDASHAASGVPSAPLTDPVAA